jgi:tRNA-specific 2-thiouridylase
MIRLARPGILSDDEVPIEVKIRSRHSPLPATVRMMTESRAQVRFNKPGPAVTPGQACVFYRNDEVLGGGIIEAGLEP